MSLLRRYCRITQDLVRSLTDHTLHFEFRALPQCSNTLLRRLLLEFSQLFRRQARVLGRLELLKHRLEFQRRAKGRYTVYEHLLYVWLAAGCRRGTLDAHVSDTTAKEFFAP